MVQTDELTNSPDKGISADQSINNTVEDKLLTEAYDMIQQGVFDIQSEMARELSMHKIESKKEVYAEKEHYIDAVMSAVKKQLLSFRKTDEYIEYLKKCVAKASEKLDGLTRIYVSRTDFDVIRAIFSDIEVKQDLRIMLGGIIAENDGLTMDFTFERKLRAEREKFEQKINEL
ncbi:MAG: V-type ATP synthase subunit E [Clostridia bacterium]|nr:V-type ATP synthase subunit E [Clostridia bacterium]